MPLLVEADVEVEEEQEVEVKEEAFGAEGNCMSCVSEWPWTILVVGEGWPTKGLEDSTLGLEESTLGLEDSTLGLDESTLGLKDSMLGLEDSMLGLEESTLGLEELTVLVGLEEATVLVVVGCGGCGVWLIGSSSGSSSMCGSWSLSLVDEGLVCDLSCGPTLLTKTDDCLWSVCTCKTE